MKRNERLFGKTLNQYVCVNVVKAANAILSFSHTTTYSQNVLSEEDLSSLGVKYLYHLSRKYIIAKTTASSPRQIAPNTNITNTYPAKGFVQKQCEVDEFKLLQSSDCGLVYVLYTTDSIYMFMYKNIMTYILWFYFVAARLLHSKASNHTAHHKYNGRVEI